MDFAGGVLELPITSESGESKLNSSSREARLRELYSRNVELGEVLPHAVSLSEVTLIDTGAVRAEIRRPRRVRKSFIVSLVVMTLI